MAEYRVTAEAIDSRCPFVKVGDRMVIEGTMVDLERTTSICTVALAAIQYSLVMMGKPVDPVEFGRADTYELQCPDVSERVIFQISRETL
jgi:uncharacterized repeat protein (TIGR04076 family)